MQNEKDEYIKNFMNDKFKNILYNLFFLLIGAFFVYGFFETRPKQIEPFIQWVEAGKMSVAINEHNELMFLDRNSGRSIVIDSLLTEVIDRKFSSAHYLKANERR